MRVADGSSTVYMMLQLRMSEAGYRITKSRRALLRLLAGMKRPLSVPEMVEAVKQVPAAARLRNQQSSEDAGGSEIGDSDAVNVVTIYRLVNIMVEMGLLRRVEFGQGYFRYELAEPRDESDHHHHVVCDQCGIIEDFKGCADLKSLTDRVSSDLGFTIQRHQLELYGTCASCADGRSPRSN